MTDYMITEKMTVKDALDNLSPEKAEAECLALKELLKVEDISQVEYIRKYDVGAKAQFNDDESAAIQWVSTREVDRDSEIMVPEGAILTEYKRNPVVLWAHNYSEPPIGSDEWIKIVKGKGILAKTVYSNNEFPQEIYRLKKEGHLRAQSVGFIIVEAIDNGADGWSELIGELGEKWGDEWSKWMKKSKDSVRRIITKWILLEHSDVPVPSNPSALVEAVAKGLKMSDKTRTDLHYDEHLRSGGGDPDSEWIIRPEDIGTTSIPKRNVRHVPIVKEVGRKPRIVKHLPEETKFIRREKLARMLELEIAKRTGRIE